MPSTAAPPTRFATTTVALRCWPSECSRRGLELDRAAVAELDEPFELAMRALALLLDDHVDEVPADPALGVVAERRRAGRGWRS